MQDLLPSAPIESHVTNPFDQVYKIEDCMYDNAPPQIKEIIDDLSDAHNDYYTTDQLDQLTAQIKHNQLSYIRDAITYYNIKTKKLYKDKYSNFNDWSVNEVGTTAWRVNQKIEAGGVSLKLIAAGHTQLPLNSSQAYALHKLDDKRLVEVWETVLDMYALHEITQEKILLVAYPPEPTKLLKPNYVKLSPATYEKLVLGALSFRQSINDYVSNLIKSFELQNCKYFLAYLLSLNNNAFKST